MKGIRFFLVAALQVVRRGCVVLTLVTALVWLMFSFGPSWLTTSVEATTLLYDRFIYPAGNLAGQGSWVDLPGSGDEVLVTAGSLSYPGLTPPQGNKIEFGGQGNDPEKPIPSQTSGTVYYSFILNVSDATLLNSATGGYMAGFFEGTAGSSLVFGAPLFLKSDGTTAAQDYNIATLARTATTGTFTFTSTAYPINTNVLIVVSYQFVAGTENDVVNLWVNPASLGGSAPAPTLTATNAAGSGTDLASIDGFFFRQSNNGQTPILAADELRVGTTYAEVTPTGPTASNGSLTGRILASDGNPVEGAVVRLNGAQNRKFITDANGFYRFDNVETNGFYTVTPSRANYSFNPSVRSFSQIGETTEAAFGATLTSGAFVDLLDMPEYFVRQHYLDFLGREPDEAGFNFWSDQIIECGVDQNCIDRRRENVSAAYFLSIEFQETGGLVDGLYRASYGRQAQYSEFMPDARAVGLGVRVGDDGWEAKLLANKTAFANAFVNRPAFHAAYDGMDNSLFVDTLIGHTGVTFTTAERDALVSGLANGTQTRADVLRSFAENNRFVNAKFNEAFVMMEYLGYLRRDADSGGFAFWLNKLNEFNGDFERAEMVKAFLISIEYRQRFPR